MKPKAPCKDCDERYSGCHGKCDKYKTWSNSWTEANRLAKKDLEDNTLYRNVRKGTRRRHS